jgi:hypothetical protein
MCGLLSISNNTNYTISFLNLRTDKKDFRSASNKPRMNAVFYTTTPSSGKIVVLTGI